MRENYAGKTVNQSGLGLHHIWDDLTQLQSARHDPMGFIQHLNSPHVVLDEIQRVPELF